MGSGHKVFDFAQRGRLVRTLVCFDRDISNTTYRYHIVTQEYNHQLDSLDQANSLIELSEQLLDATSRLSHHRSDLNFARRRLDCHRNRSVIAIYKNESGASSYCQTWIAALKNHIHWFQDLAVIKMLPMAYNEMGCAMMQQPNSEEAMKWWLLSCETVEQQDESTILSFPLPWINRALVAAFEGDAAKGLAIMQPIMQERQATFGVDDTNTFE